MATSAATWTREALAAAPQTYFDAVDAMDVDADPGALRRRRDAHGADRSRHVHGADEIRRMFDGLHRRVEHDLPRDPQHRGRARGRGKVATEQSYVGELKDGTVNDMHNCNFFDFDADGRFKRVIIWMAGTSPLEVAREVQDRLL